MTAVPDAATNHRCLLLLTEHGGTTRIDRHAALVDATKAIADIDCVELRLWLQVDDDPLNGDFGRAPFGSAIDIDAPDFATLLSAVELLQLSGSVFDLDGSSAIGGRVHVLDPGEAALGLMFAMNSKANMSVAEFHHYWLNEHAPKHAHRSGAGYQQLHGVSNDSRRVANAAGVGGTLYDGVALAVVDELPNMGGDRTDRGDRENFVDPATEVGMILERVG